MNSVDWKARAMELGADLVGIASIELLDVQERAKILAIAPNTRSVIVVGHRIMRGTLRGIEEGTNFGSTYGCFGKSWMEEQFLGKTAYELACALEREGIEAVPLQTHVEGNKVTLDLQKLAEAAGLGEVGKGGFFLTPKYGHRQRFAIILADAELPADSVCKPDLCAGCTACADACPLKAIKVSGNEFLRDESLCAQCKNGAMPGLSDKIDRYAAACGRACMIALEKKVGNQFVNTFRKRSPWAIDLDGAPTASLSFVGGDARNNKERSE